MNEYQDENRYDSEVRTTEQVLLDVMQAAYRPENDQSLSEGKQERGGMCQALDKMRRFACELSVFHLRLKVQQTVDAVADEETTVSLLQDIEEADGDDTVMRKTLPLWERIQARLDARIVVKGWVTDPFNELKGAIHNVEVYQKAQEYVARQFRRYYLASLKRRVRRQRQMAVQESR